MARSGSASAVARAEAGRSAAKRNSPMAETFRTRAMVRMGYMAWCALMNR